jgi:hypothetical protein
MGVTIFYRGSLSDLSRVEDFEDRALDLALELGGEARIWRSAGALTPGPSPKGRGEKLPSPKGRGENPQRVIRGVTLDLFPGQETTSLLISPEGWLVGLMEIEAAEKGELTEPPLCWVKTQFGPVEGHVALVEIFAALKREFLPDLEVTDEGEYWETRDLAGLCAKFGLVQAAIDGMAEGLERYGLSAEAAEDREILVARVERIARLVQQTLSRPAEHPPVRWGDEELGFDDGSDGTESQWDASFKENRRRQEHVQRAIEEHLAEGDEIDAAFEAAMREETAAGLPQDPSDEPSEGWAEEFEEDEAEDDEAWKESLTEPADEDEDEDFDFAGRPRHPLQRRVMDLNLRLHDLLKARPQPASSHRDVLMRGAGDMLGGLAQALSGGEDWEPDCGLAVVQLKRALRGAAFALGALHPLRADGTLDEPAFKELHATIEGLQTDVFAELCRFRQRGAGEG